MGQIWVPDAVLSLDGFKEGRVEAGRPAQPVCLFGMRGRVGIRKAGRRGRREELVLGKHPDTNSRITW